MMLDLQKARFARRLSAFLFDLILWTVLVVGAAFLVSQLTQYDVYNEQLSVYYHNYETQYDIDLDISQEDYLALSEAELEKYEQAAVALEQDSAASQCYNALINLTLVIATAAILLAHLIYEFLIPLMFGNGQTLGKKIFGLGVMSTDFIKLHPMQLLIRMLLGKFTLETMVPASIVALILFGDVGILGTVMLAAIALLQVILLIATRTNSPIHDLLAKTVVIDLQSQMIFASRQELLDHQQEVHAEAAQQQGY